MEIGCLSSDFCKECRAEYGKCVCAVILDGISKAKVKGNIGRGKVNKKGVADGLEMEWRKSGIGIEKMAASREERV